MAALIRTPFGDAASMRQAYGEALVELGRARADVVVLTADVSSSDFSYMFESAFPERFFNVGIAEPALVDSAVGLANSGFVPIANTFAFLFSTRAVEMVRTHLCYGKANVKLAGAFAGLSDSFDGPTHHAISDLAILRSMPNITLVVPADPLAVARLLPQVVAWDGPVYFRLCRNDLPQVFTSSYTPEIGKGITLVDGDDVTVIACGVMVARSIQAAQALSAQGISVRVVEMHTVKPLDTALVERCASDTGAIVTVEEHSVVGGLGGAVAECLVRTRPVPVEMAGIADTFTECGPYDELLEKYGMGVDAITAAILRVLERKGGGAAKRLSGKTTRNETVAHRA